MPQYWHRASYSSLPNGIMITINCDDLDHGKYYSSEIPATGIIRVPLTSTTFGGGQRTYLLLSS